MALHSFSDFPLGKSAIGGLFDGVLGTTAVAERERRAVNKRRGSDMGAIVVRIAVTMDRVINPALVSVLGERSTEPFSPEVPDEEKKPLSLFMHSLQQEMGPLFSPSRCSERIIRHILLSHYIMWFPIQWSFSPYCL